MKELFDLFIDEKRYLTGVSPNTIDYHQCVKKAFASILAEPTKEGMMACIQGLLERGVSAISVNTYPWGLSAAFLKNLAVSP
jgi:hypothetical protein